MRFVLFHHSYTACAGRAATWPYSAEWGYYPSGGLGLVLIIILILVLIGRV
jgi:hypothetical protein